MIAVVDYKAGNLTSVKLAFDAIGVSVTVTDNPSIVMDADRVVFPGVGSGVRVGVVCSGILYVHWF
jgi:glutamine amidotransferase